MPEYRAATVAGDPSIDLDDPSKALRQLGARAHQLRASTQAADHFIARDTGEDRDTGSWLMSCALSLAKELAADVDNLARALKEKPSDAALQQTVASVRVRAHQVQAAARAADHFLDQDTRDSRETGGWLVATALTLARKVAEELDNSTAPSRRPAPAGSELDPHDAALARRTAAATKPLRGAA